MWTYPIFLDVRGRPCTVLGSGREVTSKVRRLLDAGARVRLISPEIDPELAPLAAQGLIDHLPRAYRPGDLEGAFLILSERHRDARVNDAVKREADALQRPVNVVDDPPNCSFAFPSIARRGELMIAISTAGRAPALAVRLKERLERELGEEYARFLALAGSVREPLARRFPSFEERRQRWYRLVDSDALELLRRGEDGEARRRFAEILGVEPEADEEAGANGAP